MTEIVLVGGPHDGATLSTSMGAAFLFTDGKRCYRAPSSSRTLYRSTPGPHLDGRAYQHVGHVVGLCSCGVFRSRGVDCQLCGSDLLVG